MIAGILNRNGLLTGNGNRWTRERLTALRLRSHHKIPVFRSALGGSEPWLNLSDAAKLLKIAPKTLRIAAETGVIDAIHPLANGPWIFSRDILASNKAKAIGKNASSMLTYPTGTRCDQHDLFNSTT